MSKVLEDLVYNVPYPLFNNQWLLEEISGENEFTDMKFMLHSVSLPNPFPQFETETLPNGVSYYTDVKYEKEWSFTITETLDVRAFSFIKNWTDSLYKNHSFNLANGEYTKDFLLSIYKPDSNESNITGGLVSQTIQNRAVTAADLAVTSAIGRLERGAAQVLARGITSSGTGATLVHRAVDYAVSSVGGSVEEVISGGADSLLAETNNHTESEALVYRMTNTIIKSVEKLDLEYGDGEPIQWKVTLASDQVEVAFSESEINRLINRGVNMI